MTAFVHQVELFLHVQTLYPGLTPLWGQMCKSMRTFKPWGPILKSHLSSVSSSPSPSTSTSFPSPLFSCQLIPPRQLYAVIVKTTSEWERNIKKLRSAYIRPLRLTKVSVSVLKSLSVSNQDQGEHKSSVCGLSIANTPSVCICWWTQNWKRKALIILRQVSLSSRYWLFVCGERFGKFN